MCRVLVDIGPRRCSLADSFVASPVVCFLSATTEGEKHPFSLTGCSCMQSSFSLSHVCDNLRDPGAIHEKEMEEKKKKKKKKKNKKKAQEDAGVFVR
eukprot:jgi/Botrbrau1/16510/Bobra.0142s0104.1